MPVRRRLSLGLVAASRSTARPTRRAVPSAVEVSKPGPSWRARAAGRSCASSVAGPGR